MKRNKLASMVNLRKTLLIGLLGCVGFFSSNALAQDWRFSEASELLWQATLLYNERRFQEAIPLVERSLAIQEKKVGGEHLDITGSLLGLGMLYQAMGDYSRAEPLYQRVLVIQEKEVGGEHLYVAETLNNMGMLYQAMGDYSRAESLYQRSLAIREKALGGDHGSVANSLHCLGCLYYDMGDYGRAEPLYKRALAIKEKDLGGEHPHVASIQGNLGLLYLAQGKLDEAYRILEKDDKGGWSTGLGKYHLLKGNYKKATSHFEMAVEYTRKTRESTHLVGSTIGLGLSYEGLKQYREAAEAFNTTALFFY
jgi:tetratricopeptide (TPR) repeat protein